MNQPIDYTNSLEYSVPFEYPPESGSMSEEQRIVDATSQRTQEFLGTFLSFVIPAHNSRLACIAFAYVAGYPVHCILGCDNTMTDIAVRIGVTKQSFSIAVKQIAKQFNIRCNTGMKDSAKEIYKHTNYRQG